MADQRICRRSSELARLPHTFKAALHGHHVALGIKAAPAGPARHLQKLTAHQRAVASLGALAQRRNHRCASRHVDAGRQGFGGKHHLDQPLLEQLLDQLLPGRQHTGMVGGNAPQQCLGVATFPHRLGGY